MQKLSTPWGIADDVQTVVPGILRVSTPSHGGYKLDAAHNAKVPRAARRKDGWYEEDCDWAIVALTFPNVFPHDAILSAVTMMERSEYFSVARKSFDLPKLRFISTVLKPGR